MRDDQKALNGWARDGFGDSAAEGHAASSAAGPRLPSTDVLHGFFREHSRSFSFAAHWFSAEEYRLVARVYAFCRTTDDLVDQSAAPAGQVKKQLHRWLSAARAAYEGNPSGISWLDEIMIASARADVPFQLIDDLTAGVRMDVGEVGLPSMEALHLYTYRVASVVGMWLCYLFDVRAEETLQRAAALGRAMQITNILRDVGEDLRRRRIYLPADVRARYGVTDEALAAMASGAKPITGGYKVLIEELMERADTDYRYAFRGLADVPSSFARASAVAAEVYQGIHRAIRRNGYDNFQRRAYTRWPEKVLLSARGLYRLRCVRRRPYTSAAAGRTHVTGQPASPFTPPEGFVARRLI